MSTKSSLRLVNWNEPHEIHIYKECFDDKYYIENNEAKIELSKEIAERFADVLKDMETCPDFYTEKEK